jgi:N-glycosylase/DNA lyase
MPPFLAKTLFPVCDYDLAATLNSGQAFRWEGRRDAWEGVLRDRWVRLRQQRAGILAETLRVPPPGGAAANNTDSWLADYLQIHVDLKAVLATFPDDAPMRAAVAACRGLRLLRQEPWECLASFLLSSTKQIVQIRQIVRLLCERFGDRLAAPPEGPPAYSFPSAARLAACEESALRDCKMGFRASYLLKTARLVSAGEVRLESMAELPAAAAREELLRLPGVGPKIADCVLLFAYGCPTAFPVDVWIMKALRRLYFPLRRASPRELRAFADTHFGPNAGYAQQYLFHHERQRETGNLPGPPEPETASASFIQ